MCKYWPIVASNCLFGLLMNLLLMKLERKKLSKVFVYYSADKNLEGLLGLVILDSLKKCIQGRL